MPDKPRRAQEKTDLDVRLVAWVALGILAFGVLIHGGLWGLLETFVARQGTAGMGPPDALSANRRFAAHAWPAIASAAPPPPMLHLPPFPREQSDPAAELHDELARERAEISGYSMLDPKRGLVTIPIDRAMAVLAQRGLHSPNPGKRGKLP